MSQDIALAVEVTYDRSNLAGPVSWGPFLARREAERCVANLAGRSDVLHAMIVPFDGRREEAKLSEMKKLWQGVTKADQKSPDKATT